MCLIVYQTIGSAPLADDAFINAWKANPDGAGYMFAANGELVIRKPFFKLKHLRNSYRKDFALHGQSSPFVVHFRYATHGGKDATNTHPHLLDNGEVGLVHNGILDFDPPFKSDISDTVHFCRTVLAYRNAGDCVGEKFRGILADMIGFTNKLVLMDKHGTVSVVNEELGHWNGTAWYSNSTYQRAVLPCVLPAHYRMVQAEIQRGYLFAGCASEPDVWDTEIEDKSQEINWDALDEREWQERFLERELDRKLRDSA